MSGKRKSESQIDKGNYDADTLVDNVEMAVGDDENDTDDEIDNADDIEEEQGEEELDDDEEGMGDDAMITNDDSKGVSGTDNNSGDDSNTTSAEASSAAVTSDFKKSKSDIKKPLSSWTIFIAESTRSSNVAFDLKKLGLEFKALSPEERARIDVLAAEDKERYRKEMATYKEYMANNVNLPLLSGLAILNSNGTATNVPLARIKRTIQYDPDVKNIQKEAVAVAAKVTDLFIGYLAVRCASSTSLRGAKACTERDFLNTIHTNMNLEFLRLDFPAKSDFVKPLVKEAHTPKKPEVVTGAGSIQNFFGGSSSSKQAVDIQSTDNDENDDEN